MAHLTFYQLSLFIITVILKVEMSKYVERAIQVNCRAHKLREQSTLVK